MRMRKNSTFVIQIIILKFSVAMSCLEIGYGLIHGTEITKGKEHHTIKKWMIIIIEINETKLLSTTQSRGAFKFIFTQEYC